MYARFYRWASDRLGDEGVLAFVTNRSFIDSRTFDGFRKLVATDFQEISLIDLGGDVRANPKLSGTKNNVFGIQTGVAIALLVRTKAKGNVVLRYARRPEYDTTEEKLSWLGGLSLAAAPLQTIYPKGNGDWLNQTDDRQWETLIPLAGLTGEKPKSLFARSAIGVSTNRDEWVFDRHEDGLSGKAAALIEGFVEATQTKTFDDRIKWSRNLKRRMEATAVGRPPTAGDNRAALYRPYTKRILYDSTTFGDERGALDAYLPLEVRTALIALSGAPSGKPFQAVGTDAVPSLDLLEKTKILSRYRCTKAGERVDNITDWALGKFVAQYGRDFHLPAERRRGKAASSDVGAPTPAALGGVGARDARSPAGAKDAIFHYVYAVLHDPVYRETYALNLKREFPRIPFYPGFARWAAWGEQLMAMHIGYEEVAPWPVERIDTPNPKRAEGTTPKPILKSVPEQGLVRVDEDTQLTGIPREAWAYRLGNRSAINWVLDQHKEKTPRDPTIRAKFNTYRFADYKESMIALLAKVVRVSVDTVAITEAMRALDRTGW